MEEIRINKFISNSGVCSRRNAEVFIKQGRVRINGQVITELSVKVTSKDKVEIDGKEIFVPKDKVYIMLNKPKGYITTSKEQFNRPSVLDLISVNQRVYPVGRLDMDSEGMLLLTNDGELTNRIIHPTKHVAKKYEVRLKNDITAEAINRLKEGVDIGGYITRPANVEELTSKSILITIYEGKNRQIRRMCEAVDNKVVMLKRVQIGNLKLGEIKCGEYKILSEQDLAKIFE